MTPTIEASMETDLPAQNFVEMAEWDLMIKVLMIHHLLRLLLTIFSGRPERLNPPTHL
jgi:hypothetical protein